jgi:hypothetical protein
MTSKILLATLLFGFFLSVSSTVIPAQRKAIKPIDFSNPETFADKTNIVSDDTIKALIYIADSIAIRTYNNVQKIKENNKILKNYEMESNVTKNP